MSPIPIRVLPFDFLANSLAQEIGVEDRSCLCIFLVGGTYFDHCHSKGVPNPANSIDIVGELGQF